MIIRRIDIKELSPNGTVFQSSYWAIVKQQSGWDSFAFSIKIGKNEFTLLVLVKKLAPLVSLAYIPFGPPLATLHIKQAESLLENVAITLRRYLPFSVFTLRYDLPFEEIDEQGVSAFHRKRLMSCEMSVQPEATVRIPLQWGYLAVVAGYRERARRALRKASTAFFIRQYEGDTTQFDAWYEVYLETARRDGFSVRSKAYLYSLLNLGEDPSSQVKCTLLLAYQEETIVGGIIVLFNSYEAIYLFGASLRFEGLSCSYPLQDHAIKLACESGCAFYDFYGIAGPNGRGSHLAGLEIFKRSFGGQTYFRAPSTDYIYRRLPWAMYTALEKIRYKKNRNFKSLEEVPPNS